MEPFWKQSHAVLSLVPSDIKWIENHCECSLDENQHPSLGGSEEMKYWHYTCRSTLGSPTFKHMATELWGLVVLFQLGQSHGRSSPHRYHSSGLWSSSCASRSSILRVQVGAQAVDFGDVAGQVLVHLFG